MLCEKNKAVSNRDAGFNKYFQLTNRNLLGDLHCLLNNFAVFITDNECWMCAVLGGWTSNYKTKSKIIPHSANLFSNVDYVTHKALVPQGM